MWRGLENGARLAQNQRAYSVLLSAVRELARSTLCPYLQSSLLHFCSGLSGLLGSISGLMNALGYTPPLHSSGAASLKYGPLLTSQQRTNVNNPVPLRSNPARNQGDLATSGVRDGLAGADGERKRDRERERGRRGKRREGESWAEKEDEERDEGLERWGRRRKLLTIEDDRDANGYDRNNTSNTHMSYFSKYSEDKYSNINGNNSRFPMDALPQREREQRMSGEQSVPLLFSSPSLHPVRSGRALPSPPTLSPLSFLYPDTEGQDSLATGRPALNDFTRKVEGFWVLRELQSWLWRSAKDFTRLKKRLRV